MSGDNKSHQNSNQNSNQTHRDDSKASDSGRRSGEVVIEINGKNRHVKFGPYKSKKPLRGRWQTDRLPLGTSAREGSNVLNVREIPGLYICANLDKGECSIIDPLSFAKNRDVLNAVSAALGNEVAPQPPRVFENRTPAQMATWLHAMKRLVDGQLATIVKLDGEWPSVAGRVQVDFYNSFRKGPKFLDEFPEPMETAAA
jgi:hypothetical protein